MLPVAPALLGQALTGDAGALTLVLLVVGIILGVVWALKIRDPSVNRKKYG